jgi:hypothetical protein
MQQIVRDGTVRVVAMTAVLGDRRMLPYERAFLLRMTFITELVQGVCFQVPEPLTVSVVTVRTDHLAFPNGMVGWQGRQTIYLRMAFIACRRFVYGHRSTLRADHMGMVDRNHALDVRFRMGIMTIGTCHIFAIVNRRMPRHRR